MNIHRLVQHPKPRQRMRLLIVMTIVLCVMIYVPAFALTRYESNGVTIVAAIIDGNLIDGSYKVVADKSVYAKMIDQAAGTFFEAESDKMMVIIGSVSGPMGAIKSAELCGLVKLTYTTCDPKTSLKTVTTATADSATYDGVVQKAYLVGNVKIVNTNPALYTEPAVMTGDKATIDLKSTPSPAFRLESSPGLSRIELTPKKEATAPK
ncbi:LPS export ABC transporter periplasmic protein LptC [bacterium]|nr:LPS export ABC transporter periplasmic protein LptC [bacterium]